MGHVPSEFELKLPIHNYPFKFDRGIRLIPEVHDDEILSFLRKTLGEGIEAQVLPPALISMFKFSY